jgi:hypothetical protein
MYVNYETQLGFPISVFSERWSPNELQADLLRADVEQICKAKGLIGVNETGNLIAPGAGFNVIFTLKKSEIAVPMEPLSRFIQLEKDYQAARCSIPFVAKLLELEYWMSDAFFTGNSDDDFILKTIRDFPRIALNALHYDPQADLDQVNHDLCDMERQMTLAFERLWGPFFNSDPAHLPNDIIAADIEVVEKYLFQHFFTAGLHIKSKDGQHYDDFLCTAWPDDIVELDEIDLEAAAEVVKRFID